MPCINGGRAMIQELNSDELCPNPQMLTEENIKGYWCKISALQHHPQPDLKSQD